MSNLITNNIQAQSGGVITLQPGTSIAGTRAGGIAQPGMIIQTQWVSTKNRQTMTSPSSGDGQRIYDLDIDIKPSYSNSVIWLQYMLFFEMHYDNVFVIQRNGALVGYNTQMGNSMWSGVAVSNYDQDVSSTPQNAYISYYDSPGTTNNTTYSLATRCSSNTSYTLYLNRTAGSWGQSSYETGVSFVVAMEIAQ
jgi:hypothetical protein